MSKKNAASASGKAPSIKDIQRLAMERQAAWDRARDLSMELHEAIEASGLTPTQISAAAPISRVAIYSLKRQMEARKSRTSKKSGGK